MRIWHKDLIPVLPREQLVSTWRELSAIAGSIQKKGTPNHLLVNFIMNYDLNHFINYALLIKIEMNNRGYRTSDSIWIKIVNLKPDWEPLAKEKIYSEKMDNIYLTICYWNLYEKFSCKDKLETKSWKDINYQYLNCLNKIKK